MLPGTGAIIAAVATAGGRQPEVAGKPEAPTVALVRERFGTHGVVVGDRPSSDGALAAALGWPFALVLSGVTAAVAPPGGEAIPSPPPPYVAADLGALAPAARRRPALRRHGLHAYPAAVTVRRRLDAELVRRGLLAEPRAGGRRRSRRAG